MRLRYQRMLYITFILAFIIAAPAIILYTAGYRYDFKNNRLQKTGILYLDSEPNGALIFLNGKFENKTPMRFNRLLPGDYDVEIEKTGYHTWKKKLAVKSNLTTFSRNIILFKKSLPINTIEGQINIFADAPSHDKIIFSTVSPAGEELKLINLNTNTQYSIQTFEKQSYTNLSFVEWSPDQSQAMIKEVIGNFNRYLIIDINTLNVRDLLTTSKINYSVIKWSASDNGILYGLRDKILYELNLNNNTVKNVIADEISDFQAAGSYIYYITKNGPDQYLNRYNQSSIEAKIDQIKLPSVSDFTLQQTIPSYLVLLDSLSGDLFIIKSDSFGQPDIDQNIVLQDRAKAINWSDDNKSILYYTDFELWTFNLETGDKNLINRYSEPISHAIWYAKGNYVIYQTANELRAIETSKTDTKNDLLLSRLPQINDIVIDSVGKNLYLLGKVGKQEGVYQLSLQ